MACCVWVLIRPAEAIEPPEGNSTVVVLLRVRNPGIVSPAKVIWTEFVDVRDFGRNSQLDTSRGQDDRCKVQGHAVGLLREPKLADPGVDAAPALLAGGDRDGAAGHEFCAFPRDRRDGGLGKRVGDALALEGLEGGAQVLAPLEPIQSRLGGGDGAVDGERIFEAEASVRPAAVQIDAELLDDLAMNFRDRDVQNSPGRVRG